MSHRLYALYLQAGDLMKHPKLLIPAALLSALGLLWIMERPLIGWNPDKTQRSQDLRSHMDLRTPDKWKPAWSQPPGVQNLSRYQILYPVEALQLYFYRAFVDDRFERSVLRIFGMQPKALNLTGYRCQLSSVEGAVKVTWEVVARWQYVDDSWPHWSTWYALMLECTLTDRIHGVLNPEVTVVLPDRSQRVKVPIEFPEPSGSRGSLAICVKPLTGQFHTSRILEWIETQRLAGVHDFILYDTDLFGASRFVLEYYQSLGHVTSISFPYLTAILERAERNSSITPQERYAVYQQTYLVALHDCLYRFHKLYDYLVVIDVDELLLPASKEPLINSVRRAHVAHPEAASFLFLTSWHFEESGEVKNPAIPDYLYMQRYAIGSLPIDNQPKSIHVTNRTVTFNFHVAITASEQEYTYVILPWMEYGYLHHYRGLCKVKFAPQVCSDILHTAREDPVLPAYRQEVSRRVRQVLTHLQLT